MAEARVQAARRNRRGHPALGLGLLVVVLAVALAFGAGLGSASSPSNAARAAAIDATIRCPSCVDLSVAQSSASAAVAVRHEVAHLVRLGRTDQQIQARLVTQYGPTILLNPPASGLGVLVWVLPPVGAAAAAALLAILFWRRSRQLRALRAEAP